MNRLILASSFMAALLGMSLHGQEAFGQYGGSSSRSIVNATRNYLYNRPTVSPYLNLTSRDATYGMPLYFTQVRPQVEQRDREIMADRQSAQMQAQLNKVQAEVMQNQQQAAGMVLTGRVGWSSRGFPRFGAYMSYYPGFQRIPR